MNLSFGLKAMIAIAIIGSVLFAAPTIGRFMPTHKIVEPVYCGSCHPEQAEELAATTHLPHFAKAVQDITTEYGATPKTISEAEATTGGCTMCHNYWDNFKWFGVTNLAIVPVEVDNPETITDIYGNTVSPYGLGSTQTFSLQYQEQAVPLSVKPDGHDGGVEPWKAGIDTYEYTDANGVKHSRLDYVWSALSVLSPGPVVFELKGTDGNVAEGCGTAEKGLCHAAEQAVAMAAVNMKLEFPDQANAGNAAGAVYQGDTDTYIVADKDGDGVADAGESVGGQGVFFGHEMAFTTAQYAAKPVKLCGACHVFKLPAMKWGGEPWMGDDIKAASGIAVSGDPFGFDPTYDMTGFTDFVRSGKTFDITYRSPDWAHQIVPCMRCHVHAGINGEAVSSNK